VETLRKNTAITTSIVALFLARFDPHLVATGAERSARETAILAEIEEQLKSVASLDEDRHSAPFSHNLVQATVRTNLWQIGRDGHPRSVISFKFEARKIEGLAGRRDRFMRFSSIRRVSKAFICASAKWHAAACAGPTARRISAPRFSGWLRH